MEYGIQTVPPVHVLCDRVGFGGGAHKCIGMHFADMLYKCVLAETLKNYRFTFAKADQYPSKIQHFPFAKPMDDLPLVLEPLK